jgi:hypothetical protein
LLGPISSHLLLGVGGESFRGRRTDRNLRRGDCKRQKRCVGGFQDLDDCRRSPVRGNGAHHRVKSSRHRGDAGAGKWRWEWCDFLFDLRSQINHATAMDQRQVLTSRGGDPMLQ